MNKYIEKYINQKIFIFPCIKSDDKAIDKSPAIREGFYSAVNDYETSKKQFYKDDLYIGMPTGHKNGIVVVDIDINKKIPGTDDIDPRTVEELKEEVKSSYGELPDTYSVETPSGGRHLYYSVPEGTEFKSSKSTRFLDKTLSVDLKAEGGYVIAADGINYIVYDDVDGLEIDNIKSRCAPVPQWIIDFKKQSSENTENLPANILPVSEVKEIRSALSYLSSEDRDLWVKVGMALKSTGSATAYGLWNEWSKTSDKYNPDDMEKRWATLKPNDITIASLFHIAKGNGWITTYDKEIVAPQGAAPTIKKIKQIQKEFKKAPFPSELLNPGGLVGDIIEYVLEKSIKLQPIFALSSALCAVGALAGRKVQSETGTRTNIYCLNVGGSGCGKEAPRKAVKEIFEAAKCGDKASVEDLASDSAIITELDNIPSQMFLIDEIGRFLNATRKGNPSHQTKIIDVLLKLYGNADQNIYGKSYADKEKKVKLYQPNLCLLGTTVPDVLYKGLNPENATDGFLSRMLIFETDNNRPRKQKRKNFLSKPGKELIEKVKRLNQKPIKLLLKGNLDHLMIPDPQVVYKNDNAYEMLDSFDDYIEDLRDELEEQNRIEVTYNRITQSAEKIALIIAVGKNIDDPVITETEMSYGISLTKFLADHMLFIIENHIAKNEHEHEVKRILHVIRMSGCISLTDISKKTQNLHGQIRKDILETLRSSGQINISTVGKGPSATKMLTAT